MDAHVVCDCLQQGMTISESTSIVNMSRHGRSLAPISWSAVRHFISKAPYIKSFSRRTKKSGATDKNSNWAKARLAQAFQFKKQLAICRGEAPVDPNLRPIFLEEVVFWDEKHKKL